MVDLPAASVPIVIRALVPRDLPDAASVLAAGMRDNPLHVVVFGAGEARRQRRLRRFLGYAVDHVNDYGVLLGAHAQGELVGVLGMLRPGCCRPSRWRTLRIAVAFGIRNPPVGSWRIHRWLAAWARHDPSEPHWHLGPLAVLPRWRRQGIGRRLMRCACRYLDALDATAWLETDRSQNVAFYRTFGFAVVREQAVLDCPQWFMRRGPLCTSDATTRGRIMQHPAQTDL